MSLGWAPLVLEAAEGWHLWLSLAGVLVLCWGLVIVATVTLFGGPMAERRSRRVLAPGRVVRQDKPTHTRSRRGRVGDG